MSQTAAHHHRHAEPFSQHNYETGEVEALHPPIGLTSQTVHDEVQHFAHTYHLRHHLDVLQKAAIILNNGETTTAAAAEDSTPAGDTITTTTTTTAVEKQALQDEVERKWRQPKMLYVTVLVCSIGAIEQGWAQTGMNGANLGFPRAFGVGSNSKHDNLVVGLINSGTYLSTGLLGAWLSDPINNRVGRRGAVFMGAVLCLISNLGSAFSNTWPQLLAARFVLGAGLGINASTVSVYAAECAPATIRGGLAVSWQMWTAFGIFVGFVANAAAYKVGFLLSSSHGALVITRACLFFNSTTVPMLGGCNLPDPLSPPSPCSSCCTCVPSRQHGTSRMVNAMIGRSNHFAG